MGGGGGERRGDLSDNLICVFAIPVRLLLLTSSSVGTDCHVSVSTFMYMLCIFVFLLLPLSAIHGKHAGLLFR